MTTEDIASSRNELANRHGAPMIPESMNPDRNYPQMAAERGRIEPAPRRVLGYFDNTLVFDTINARYVWEIPYYPQYYIPVSDVRMEHLLDDNHPQRLQLGPSRLHSLTTDRRTKAGAARVYDSDGDGPVAGYVRFEWERLDWFRKLPRQGHQALLDAGGVEGRGRKRVGGMRPSASCGRSSL